MVLAWPATFSVRFSALAGIGANAAIQLPDLSALVSTCCPANVTVTLSPGSAWPQIFVCASRCSTRLSEKTGASRNSASAVPAPITPATAATAMVR